MRSVNKIDYAGFTFAGKHTSQFGLYSVSNGDRYNRYLSPTIKNQTAENIGGVGTYFFGSQHTQQPFNFSLAFDSVTEEELREIKQWLNSDVSALILDENPYIQYYVKVSSAPQINFIPFSTEEIDIFYNSKEVLYNPSLINISGRIYKGEISVSFIAYEPYGYSVKKWLNEYDDINKEEWAAASGLKNNLDNYYDTLTENNELRIYNGGDLDTHFILTFDEISSGELITIRLDNKNFLEIKVPENSSSAQLKIDTKKRLVIFNNKIGNNMITNGDFFKLPKGDSILQLTINNFTAVNIDYKYCYI